METLDDMEEGVIFPLVSLFSTEVVDGRRPHYSSHKRETPEGRVWGIGSG